MLLGVLCRGQCPVRAGGGGTWVGDMPSAAVGGWNFHRAPHSGLLPPREAAAASALHSSITDRIPDVLTSPLQAPSSQLPRPAISRLCPSFPPGVEAAQGEEGPGSISLPSQGCRRTGGEGRRQSEDGGPHLKGELDRVVRLKLDSKIRGGKRPLGEVAGRRPGVRGTQSCGSGAGRRWQGGGHSPAGVGLGKAGGTVPAGAGLGDGEGTVLQERAGRRGGGTGPAGAGLGERAEGTQSCGTGLGDGPTLAPGFLSPQPQEATAWPLTFLLPLTTPPP